MSYLEELLPEFKKGAKIRIKDWNDGVYLLFDTKEKIIIDQEGKVCEFTPIDIICDRWEIYQDSEPDWNYIIKNKCLCWFWDGSGDYKDLGILLKVNENNTLCRYDCKKRNGDFYQYANCRPVRRDELTFYEDKKYE